MSLNLCNGGENVYCVCIYIFIYINRGQSTITDQTFYYCQAKYFTFFTKNIKT